MIAPSHYGQSAVLVAGAFLAVTLVVTLWQWLKLQEHETALKWSAGAFTSVLCTILAIYDWRVDAPDDMLNELAAFAIGVFTIAVFGALWWSKWSSGPRGKFFVASRLCIASATASLGLNFLVYGLDDTHLRRSMIADGMLAAALGAIVVFGMFTIFFWMKSRRNDIAQQERREPGE